MKITAEFEKTPKSDADEIAIKFLTYIANNAIAANAKETNKCKAQYEVNLAIERAIAATNLNSDVIDETGITHFGIGMNKRDTFLEITIIFQ